MYGITYQLLCPATFAMYGIMYQLLCHVKVPASNGHLPNAASRMLDFIPAKAANRHGSFQICGDYYDIF